MTIHETCAGYWQSCFACPEYLPDRVFFCRRANLVRFGREEVEVEVPKEPKTGGAWWNGRKAGSGVWRRGRRLPKIQR